MELNESAGISTTSSTLSVWEQLTHMMHSKRINPGTPAVGGPKTLLPGHH